MVTAPDASLVSLNLMSAWQHTNRMLGEPAGPGLALIDGHCAGTPWLTPQRAAMLANVSDDTSRRRLNDLVAIGRADVRHLGSNRKEYRISPQVAASVIARLLPVIPSSANRR